MLDQTARMPAYPEAVKRAANRDLGMITCQQIDSLDEAELRDIVSSVPGHWLNAEQRERIVRFLIERRPIARSAASAM